MSTSATFTSGDEWSPQSPFFSKLGNYFDRPEWWDEGVETLNAFFDGDPLHADATDQRLEDLLDLLEPLKVCEEPQRSVNAGVNLSDSVENTTDLSTGQQEQKHDPRHVADQSIEQSSKDTQLQATIVDLSNDPFSAAKSAHVEPKEAEEVAPVITSGSKDSQSHSEEPALVKQFPIPSTSTGIDAINTSSPFFISTTTSTRQTSPQPDSSTRASYVFADAALSFDTSHEDEAIVPSASEVHKLVPIVRNALAGHRDDLPPELTERNNDSAFTDLVTPAENNIAPTPIENIHNLSDEHNATTEEAKTVSEDDPTGLQTIKDEISDEHGLPKAVDSSIVIEEDDATVVHDPSAAAISFFPPNPYSDTPYEFSFDDPQAPSSILTGGPRDETHDHIDDSSADSTLTSLASGDGQLPAIQLVDQVYGRDGYTPPRPSFSPLTPPPGFVDTMDADAGAMGGIDAEEGHAPLQNSKHMVTVNGVVDELAYEDRVDGTKTSTNHLTLANPERKQEQPHADEPAQKRRLSPNTEDEHQMGINSETILASREETVKRSPKPAQKGKSKANLRSAQRGSPDPLASASPDELADSTVSNPFILSKPSKKQSKPKLDRSTTSRSRAKKPVNTSAPLRKLIGVPRITRGSVGIRELAELLGASPPRTAAEKEQADVGGRLRSQSQTPAPASATESCPATQTTLATGTTETNGTGTPAQQKRKTPTGSNPVSAQELTDLGNTPILETRTRTRTATVEPAPELPAQDSAKPVPKRTKAAISNAEVERLGAVEVKESRTRNSTVEPNPEPAPVPTPAKRAKKPIAKSVAPSGAKSSPFSLVAKSKGTPKNKALAKTNKKAVEPDQKKDTPVGEQTETGAKRKRDKDSEEVGGGATRASKRIAGAEPEAQ